jgi:hypothetical protein
MSSTDSGLLTPYDLFDTSIFTLLGVADAPQSKKDEMLDSMLETVESRVFMRVMETLDDDAIQTMSDLIDADNHDGVRDLLSGFGMQLSQLMAEETMFYKAELVEAVRMRDISFAQVDQVAVAA